MVLFFNYLRLALRTAGRHRATTFVNVLGLTTGLTACLFIATFVLDELSFDRFWSKTSQLYRLVQVRQNGKNEERSVYLISGLAPKMKAAFPEVVAYARDTKARRVHLSHGGRLVKTDIWQTEPGAFRMFDFQFLRGRVDPSAFHSPTLVLSESKAKALFGDENPVGQTVMHEIPYAPAKPYTVVGVIRDLPTNSHLHADALMPTQLDARADEAIDFGSVFPQYLLLAPQADPVRLAAKAADYFNRTFKPAEKFRFALQPIAEVHLHPQGSDDRADHQSDIRSVYLFSAIGVLLLVLACINYVNFTTARALQRARETGIRKVLGANRSALVRQFLTESLLVFGVSLAVALALYSACLPALYAFIGRALTVTPFANFRLLSAIVGLALAVGVLAGLYPALVLSAFQPTQVLRGIFRRGAGAVSLRSTLVVAQFAVSLVLIVATLVVYRQLRFVNEVNLGYRKDNLLLIEGQPEAKTAAFKQALLGNPYILGISLTNWQPGTESEGNMAFDMENPKRPGEKLQVWGINADFDFLNTLQIPLLAGRAFDASFAGDRLDLDSLLARSGRAYEAARKDKSIIVNETLVRQLGLKQPLGHQLTFQSLQGRIIGVMKDIHSGPLHRTIPAMFLQASPENPYGSPVIRVRAGKLAETTAYVERVWKRFFPDRLFEYHYADEQLEQLYRSEQRLGYLFGGFAGLAVLICCLGLFGLATFTAEQRTKEIGVRKVLGASVASIVALLSKDFLKLVGLAIVIASPIAWWIMSRWLENFAYRIAIAWWFFALAGGLAGGIALLTVSFQSVKAALMNPVKSLRSE